jgi:formate dehydrogenase major subunit
MALRGHASIQGSTDVPTLYDLLAGYMPQPSVLKSHATLADYLATSAPRSGVWGNLPSYLVSLLKAWYGDTATAANDYCYTNLPRTVGDHSHLATTFDMVDGKIKGLIVMGQNPAGGSGNARLQRKALAKLDWLVVRDLYETETARFWNAPVDNVDPTTIETEIFFLPAAGPGEKSGCFTNTQRLIQWKEKAVDPPDEARSDAWFINVLAKRLKEMYAGSDDPKNRAIQDLWWDFDPTGELSTTDVVGEPEVEQVLRELNGFTWKDRRQLADASELRDDGSTACGSCSDSSGPTATPSMACRMRRP